MFGFDVPQAADKALVLGAIRRAMAVVEFDPDGLILSANDRFCNAFGYRPFEIEGRHHSLLIPSAEALSEDYGALWAKLARGDTERRDCKCLDKHARALWIRAFYSPVSNARGVVSKVVMIADILTAEKVEAEEMARKLDAFARDHAVIEYAPSGTILGANENALVLFGYRPEDLIGQHHRILVDSDEALSSSYSDLWAQLRTGAIVSASFKRRNKTGDRIHIRSSYIPIADLDGKVIKLVESATDVTSLSEIGIALSRLADRGLETPIDTVFPPDLDHLRKDFNAAQQSLKSTLLQIGDGAGAIRSKTLDILTTSDELSHRAGRQALSLNRTEGELELLAGTIRTAASHAAEIGRSIVQVRDKTKASLLLSRQATEAIAFIGRSTAGLDRFAGIIDTIARQADLMALNADIKASKADDARHQFTIMALELRHLSGQSAGAVEELKTLVLTARCHVEHGMMLAEALQNSLDGLNIQMGDVGQAATTFAAGTIGNAQALHDIKGAVALMKLVSKHSVAMVERTAITREGLFCDLHQVSNLIRQFTFGETDGDDDRRRAFDVEPHRSRPRLVAARDSVQSPSPWAQLFRPPPTLTLVAGTSARRETEADDRR